MKAKIRVLTFFLVTLFLLLPFGAEARKELFRSSVMSGLVRSYEVKMQFIVYDNNEVSGWYYYMCEGSKNKISLNGYLWVNDYGVYEVRLTESVKGKETGYFKGIYWTGSSCGALWDFYDGMWTSPSDKLRTFKLKGEL